MDQRGSAEMRVLAASFALAIAIGPVAARDLGALSSDEVLSLQRRLVDAGCYPGLLDGQVSDALAAAVKACPDQDPVLRIETGMHTAPLLRIGVDAGCTRAVTGSQDKTVRLWSLPDGRLLRTQRLPMGAGNAGRLGIVAMSPDGQWVAAGGWDAHAEIDQRHAVYLFDGATGTTVRRLGGYGSRVHHLAFSPDGAKLALALEGPKHAGVLEGAQGVRVLDVATGRELMADSAYGDDSNGVAFGPDGALYAVAYDGYVRRYGSDLRQAVRVATAGGQRPFSVAVDPAGKRLAVGYDDGVAVDILDASSLQRVASADSKGINNGTMNSVTWSADGRRVVGGATFQKGPGQFVVRIWNPDGVRLGDDVKVASNTVMGLTPCRDAIAFATADPAFGLLRSDRTVATLGQVLIPEMRGKPRGGFKASADATRLHFGLGYADTNPVLFDLSAGTVTGALKAPADLRGAVLTGLQISEWENTLKPMLNGKPVALDAYERARTIAVRDDRAGFVLGTEFNLRAISADGTSRWTKPIPSTTWSVTLARGGSVVVAAYGDGTVRWHRWSDGQELLALFVQKNDKRWVAWTPSGYFMASPGAEDLIGWHINRGWEQPADFFPVSRFRARFNRPDIIRLLLETLDEDGAIKLANDTSRRRQDAKPLIARLPPVIRITSPNEGERFDAGKLTIGYELRSPSGIPVTAIDVRLNGGLVARGLARADAEVCGGAPGISRLDAGVACSGSLAIDLPQNDIEVVLIARAGDLASEPARLKLTWGGPTASRDAQPRPKLYALVIGVSDYVTPAMALRYAAKDARDFADAFNRQRGRFYEGGRDDTRIITDREVTRAGVVDGLEWLEKKVTDRDVGVVFIAGHGYMDDRQTYWFLPADATLERLGATAVSQDDINRTLSRLAGKALLFLDTCHAGAVLGSGHSRSNIDINQVINQLSAAENGITAFASSTGREVSVERDDWRNGAFTKAIVEGLVDGRADLLRKGTITVSQLDAFVVDRVKDMTGGLQHPVMARPPTVPDFAIALVRQ